MKKANEYEDFTKLADRVLSVSREQIKAKLDEEKRAKKKRKKSRTSSASREAI